MDWKAARPTSTSFARIMLTKPSKSSSIGIVRLLWSLGPSKSRHSHPDSAQRSCFTIFTWR